MRLSKVENDLKETKKDCVKKELEIFYLKNDLGKDIKNFS